VDATIFVMCYIKKYEKWDGRDVMILRSRETDEIYWCGKHEPIQHDNGSSNASMWKLHEMVMHSV
jgi:hypothetical protein